MPNPKVLIVEDDASVREGLIDFLTLKGFDPRGSIHGQDALSQLEAGFEPDLILMDLMMPVMDGWQLRQALKKSAQWSKIPILVASAAGEETPASLRVDGILPKPLNLEHLTEYTFQALERSKARRF